MQVPKPHHRRSITPWQRLQFKGGGKWRCNCVTRKFKSNSSERIAGGKGKSKAA